MCWTFSRNSAFICMTAGSKQWHEITHTHTGQPASFTAWTELLQENIVIISSYKDPITPIIPTWVLFILYRLFITQITVSTDNIHDNRWKFIHNTYKLRFFSVIGNIAYCLNMFLSQIQGQLKKKKRIKIAQLHKSYLWQYQFVSVSLLIDISFRGWVILTILTQV